MSKKKLDAFKIFGFHGVHLTEKGNQGQGTCPFCNNESHLFVNKDSGLWDCKKGSCGKSGNVATFLHLIHEQSLLGTKEADYKRLSKLRSDIPPAVFKAMELAWDATMERWLIPARNTKGTMTNLYAWPEDGRVLSTTSLSLQLFKTPPGRKMIEGPVYLCEGPWDTAAMTHLLHKTKSPGTAIGVPGANTFANQWTLDLKGFDLNIMYDNDDGGHNGISKVGQMMEKLSPSIRHLLWPDDCPDGMDVSDIVSQSLKSPKQAYALLHKMLIDTFSPEEAFGERTRKGKPPTFKRLLKEYKKLLHVDKTMEDALTIILATALSNHITGDPLWLFLVGPPGAGKTLFLASLSDSGLCHYESSFTSTSLLSGFRTPDGEDPSLLGKLRRRCLILKDYTEIKSMSQQAQEEVCATLRGAFDGVVDKRFGNGIVRSYKDLHFSMVAGVTDIIHSDDRTSLGERFLKFEFIGPEHNQELHIRAAISGMTQSVEEHAALRDMVADFLDINSPKRSPSVPKWMQERIIALAQVIAAARAGVPRSWKGTVTYRARPEVATRLTTQLIKMGRSLCLVHGKTLADKEIYRVMQRVAFDTAYGWNLDIIRLIISMRPKKPTATELSIAANISYPSVDRRLQDLLELRIVTREKAEDLDGSGRPSMLYSINPHILSLWKKAKVGQ